MSSDTTDIPERKGGIYSRVSEMSPIPEKEKKETISLSEDDIVALKRIRKDDFWNKCVPGALTTSLAYGMLVKFQKARYTAFRAVFMSPMIGFFFGRILGATSAESRVLEYAPNGNLAYLIRKKRGLPAPELDNISMYSPAEEQRRSRLDDRKADDIKGLDDASRPSVDNSSDYRWGTSKRRQDTEGKTFKSYDDIRRENRLRTAEGNNRQDNESDSKREPVFFSDQPAPEKRKSKGKYGDLWD